MARKKVAVLGCSEKNPNSVIDRGNEVFTCMTGNLLFATPSPTLVSLQAAVTDAENKRIARGDVHHHGTSEDVADYHAKIKALFAMLKQECAYVNNTVQDSDAGLLSSGFPISSDYEHLPVLNAPLNLHRMVQKNIGMEKAKLRWNVPENAAHGQDIVYRVLRSATSSFTAAILIGEVHKTTYTDNPPVTVATTFYYWVEAITAAGVSEPSDPVTVQIVPLA